MTVYELILSIDQDILQKLHSKKLARLSIFRDVGIFEYYLNERKTNRGMQSLTNTAKRFGVSEETVSKTLQRMKCNVKLN